MQKNIEKVKKVLNNHIDTLVNKYNIEQYIFGSYATNKNDEFLYGYGALQKC